MRTAWRADITAVLGAVLSLALPALARAQDESPSAAPCEDEPAPPVLELGPPWRGAGAETQLWGWTVPRLEKRENEFVMRAGLYSANDFLIYDPSNERSSGLRFTDLRPTVAFASEFFQARLELDLIGVDTRSNIYEAWGGVTLDPAARLRIGQMRMSLGSEGATHESELPLIGYSFVPHLSTRYDIGAMLDGELTSGLRYSLFGSIGEGFGLEGQKLSSPMLGVRVGAEPFALLGVKAEDDLGFLRGFHCGVGFAELLDGDDPVVAVSPFQSRVLTTSKLGGDSGSWRHLEIGYTLGPFQVAFEDSIGSYDDVAVAGGRTNIDQLSTIAYTASLNLSGEDRGWERGTWSSAPPSDETAGLDWLPEGTWTIAARYSNGDFDRTLFDAGYTTYDPSTQELRSISLALFWSPSPAVRVGAQWTKINADNELTTFGGTNRDDSFALRLEFRF